jgi:hypothetical protein
MVYNLLKIILPAVSAISSIMDDASNRPKLKF